MELIFLFDKFVQICNKPVWAKMAAGKVSSIYFGVPMIITMFTSYLKSPEFIPLIYTVWDLVLSSGFYSLLKAKFQILKLQENVILELMDLELIVALKNLEKAPFETANYSNVELDEEIVEEELSKKKILGCALDEKKIRRLVKHYRIVHQPLVKFWSVNIKKASG